MRRRVENRCIASSFGICATPIDNCVVTSVDAPLNRPFNSGRRTMPMTTERPCMAWRSNYGHGMNMTKGADFLPLDGWA
jgi:hypothetical protein